ncbi:MAG: hypothetical protein J1E37_02435 [Prevotella sp.]|nr:hypothetical protein [Prevotella sp.]
MIYFSLPNILAHSPYEIFLSEGDFLFQTEKGIRYEISFNKEDIVFGECETYQLIIRKLNETHSPHDPKVRDTILAIVNEFFDSNQQILLYICDTSDGKENSRNRLFLHWFEKHAKENRFTIKTANAIVENERIYTTIIVENSNPKLNAIIKDFEDTAAMLTNKPEH